MSTRRDFLALLAAAALAAPATRAQPRERKWRLGYLALPPLVDPPSPERAAFVAALRDLGYVVGANLAIEYRSANSDREQLPFLAEELVRLQVDAIVVQSADPARAVLDATKSVPVVMLGVGDPVAFGLVGSLARPGANITGSSWQSLDLVGKRFELLRELLPRGRRVAYLWNPDTVATAAFDAAKLAAPKAGFTLDELRVGGAEDLQRAFDALEARRPDALFVVVENRIATYRQIIAESALRLKLPSIANYRGFVEAGGLMSYAANLTELYRRGATYVDRVLRGAKPGDLPIEQPTRFELVLNAKTARAIGVTIPRAVLARADEVIG